MKNNYLLIAFGIAISMGFFSCKEKKKELPPVEMLPLEELQIEPSSMVQLPEESSPVESFSEEQPAVESSATEQLPVAHFTKEEVEQKLIAEGLHEGWFVVDDEGKYYAFIEDGEDGMTMVLCDPAYSGFDAWLGGYIFYRIEYRDVEKMTLEVTGSIFTSVLTLKDGRVLKGTIDSSEEKHKFVYMEHKKKSYYEKRLERFEKQGIKENWYAFDDKKIDYAYIAAGKDYVYMTWGATSDFYSVSQAYDFPDLTEDDIEDASVVSSGSLFIGTVKTKDGNTYTHTFDTSKFGRPNTN